VRRLHAARRLGGNQRLQLDHVEHQGFQELGFDDGGRHLQNRLLGKENASFRDSPDRSGEPKILEIL